MVDKMKQFLDDLVHKRETDFQLLLCQKDACLLRKKYVEKYDDRALL